MCCQWSSSGTVANRYRRRRSLPRPVKTIKHELLDIPPQARIGELTVNVQTLPQIITADKRRQFIELTIPRARPERRFDLRWSLLPAGRRHLSARDRRRRTATANERPGSRKGHDQLRRTARRWIPPNFRCLIDRIRASSRVKSSVKERRRMNCSPITTDWQARRSRIWKRPAAGPPARPFAFGYGPYRPFIKYDERARRSINCRGMITPLPVELVAHLAGSPYRTFARAMKLRKVCIGATCRRSTKRWFTRVAGQRAGPPAPYPVRGDIFLNLHPDRLEVVNPGRLPLGVTPQTSFTPASAAMTLARLFSGDPGPMEREGSGFDMMYERQLRLWSTGADVAHRRRDSVHVTVRRHILKPPVIRLIETVDERFQLTQRGADHAGAAGFVGG